VTGRGPCALLTLCLFDSGPAPARGRSAMGNLPPSPRERRVDPRLYGVGAYGNVESGSSSVRGGTSEHRASASFQLSAALE